MTPTEPVSDDNLYYFDKQNIHLDDFPAQGFILDVGGGGEGIIGRLKGSQVVAIDSKVGEFAGSPPGQLNIVMDARDLKFPDTTFETATAFFSLLFILPKHHRKVLGEVFRVLKPGGRFLIWDAAVPERLDEEKELFAIPLIVRLPKEEVTVAYGDIWPEAPRDLAYFVSLAEDAGFQIAVQREEGQLVFLELRKP